MGHNVELVKVDFVQFRAGYTLSGSVREWLLDRSVTVHSDDSLVTTEHRGFNRGFDFYVDSEDIDCCVKIPFTAYIFTPMQYNIQPIFEHEIHGNGAGEVFGLGDDFEWLHSYSKRVRSNPFMTVWDIYDFHCGEDDACFEWYLRSLYEL